MEHRNSMKNKNVKRKTTRKIIGVILIAVALLVCIGLYQASQNPRVRMLLSVVHFTESTLEDPGYLLHDIDIMELCRDYANGDTQITGRIGLSGMEQVKSSIYFDVDARRSFSQQRLAANMDMDLLWIPMGQLDFYAEDQTVYMEAPLLGEDVGYAFPTGLDLFLKMPDLTSDIDRTWFRENYANIIQLTKEISIQETGETLVDEDGTVSEEFVVTIPEHSGMFIWELLGMEPPDYDVVCSLYLTRNNHLRRIYVDLSEVMEGASIVIDGTNASTAYFYYELPENEHVTLHAVRNADFSSRIDIDVTYYANTGKEYAATAYLTWHEEENGIALKVKDLKVTCDGSQLAKGYFKGTLQKLSNPPDLFDGRAEELYGLEIVDWYSVRDDTEGFINDVLATTSMSVFVADDEP